MASEPPISTTTVSDPALLERARLALRSLQFEEEAARYRAAVAELMEAIADAESGDEEPLKRWLLARRDSDGLVGSEPMARGSSPIPSTPADEPTETVLNCQTPNGQSSVPSESHSPWIRMEQAARERAKVWMDAESHEERVTGISSLDLAVEKHKMGTTAKRRSRGRILSSHIGVSLLVHGLLVLGLGWWVVAIAQPEKHLMISAGTAEFEEIALETVLEQTPSELEPSEEPESAPNAELDMTPIAPTQIAAIDIGVGPAISESNLFATSNSLNGAAGMGTNLAAGAEFFGAKAAGNNFVFVVDCSPSMARDNAFESAKEEIVRSLSMLKPKQRYFILLFGSQIDTIQFPGSEPEQYLLRASPENLEKTLLWVQRAKIQKEGRHPIDAVKQAIAMQPDGIFLLFDGDTKVGNWTGRIRDLNRNDDLLSQGETNIPIHVIHFFRDEFAPEMKRLADENEGSYRFVPRPRKGGER
ncbi:MAG: vWA domain-containing protein [Planctomycetota bacterium]